MRGVPVACLQPTPDRRQYASVPWMGGFGLPRPTPQPVEGDRPLHLVAEAASGPQQQLQLGVVHTLHSSLGEEQMGPVHGVLWLVPATGVAIGA